MAQRQVEYIVTANRLGDGRVVYLAPGRRWSEDLADASVTRDPVERDASISWAKTRERDVCGAYAIECELDARGGRILSARERLRALGPAAARRRMGYTP